MKRPFFLILIILFSGLSKVFPQKKQSMREIYLDADYFFMSEDYEEALYAYNTLYRNGYSNNANINYRIGQCYLNIDGSKQQAITYLEKACKRVNSKYIEGSFRETRAPYDAYFYLGDAYRINNQLYKAVAAYGKFKKLIGPKAAEANKIADQEIEACNNARIMMKNPVDVGFINIGRPVNTSSKDFFPALSSDGSVIVYNTSLKFYDAVFFSKKVDGSWTAPINITPEIQSDGNQYVSSLSPDGMTLFLRKEERYQADIMVSHYDNGVWSKSVPLGRHINTKYWEGNACITSDGKTLYFSSNRSGGYGVLDLYQSQLQSNGEWGKAKNLGNVINTGLNEDAPYITKDGKRLYFVSQGHNTMGGYDIFYSDLGSDGQWQKPVNMGYPVNTTDDDLHFAPVRDGKAAYIAKYSQNGYGYKDIYEVLLVPKEIELARIQAQKEAERKIRMVSRLEMAKDTTHPVLLPDVERALAETSPASESAASDTSAAKSMTTNIEVHSILFGFNSNQLDDKAKRELNYLSIIMQNEPEIKIELQGNTDAIGSDSYNFKLSIQRAVSAKKYLVNKGIASERLLVKALGKKNFIARNAHSDGTDNPSGRRYNRRVDFVLLNYKGKPVSIKKIEVPDSLKVK